MCYCCLSGSYGDHWINWLQRGSIHLSLWLLLCFPLLDLSPISAVIYMLGRIHRLVPVVFLPRWHLHIKLKAKHSKRPCIQPCCDVLRIWRQVNKIDFFFFPLAPFPFLSYLCWPFQREKCNPTITCLISRKIVWPKGQQKTLLRCRETWFVVLRQMCVLNAINSQILNSSHAFAL